MRPTSPTSMIGFGSRRTRRGLGMRLARSAPSQSCSNSLRQNVRSLPMCSRWLPGAMAVPLAVGRVHRCWRNRISTSRLSFSTSVTPRAVRKPANPEHAPGIAHGMPAAAFRDQRFEVLADRLIEQHCSSPVSLALLARFGRAMDNTRPA